MHTMSRSIYFNGQPIFSHRLSMLSRDKIGQIAAEGNYDRYTVHHCLLECVKRFLLDCRNKHHR